MDFFISMGRPLAIVDTNVASEFVCLMYSQGKVHDVNEARHRRLLQMTGKFDQVPKKNNVLWQNLLQYITYNMEKQIYSYL